MHNTEGNLLAQGDLPDVVFSALRELLIKHRQFDLAMYKDRCVRRRILKRARLAGFADAGSYLEKLRHDEDELDALLATLSIHVSQFFRNPDTFRVLEAEILPRLINQVKAVGRKELRIWSAGCAGGEEPYSMALLLNELAPADIQVSILGTDVSSQVLTTAREAIFASSRLAEVPAPLLQRFFSQQGQSFLLAQRVRDLVRFKKHNILTDEDYPEADLVLCRNVLIYFSREEQEKILRRFARILPEGGSLVLGRAETMQGSVRRFFETEFLVERIYRRRSDSEL